MMLLRSWLLGIFVTAAALSVVYTLIPKGKFLAVAKFSGGLLLLLALVRPLLQLDADDLLRGYETWSLDIRERTGETQAQQQDALLSLIADKTAAYIQTKAAQRGMSCRAEVTCEWRDGIPFPAQIQWDIPYDGTLEAMAVTDLDIPASRQFWQEDRP